MLACLRGHTDVAVAIFDHVRVDVHAKDKTVVPLPLNWHVSEWAHINCSKHCLQKHPKITCLNQSLVLASASGHVEVVREVLMHAKLNVNAECGNGRTAFVHGELQGPL